MYIQTTKKQYIDTLHINFTGTYMIYPCKYDTYHVVADLIFNITFSGLNLAT